MQDNESGEVEVAAEPSESEAVTDLDVEERLRKLEADLIAQDHRAVPVLQAFLRDRRKWDRSDPRWKASWTAFIWWCVGGLATPAGAAVGLAAFLTLALTGWNAWEFRRQNQALAEQNETLQRQLGQQERQIAQQEADTLIVRRAQLLATIYEEDCTGEGEEEVCVPKSHVRARQEAALAFVEIERGRGVRVDLRRANLSGADLSRASLEHANLLGASLIGVNLMGASLESVNLERANLHGANLWGANLEGAILINSNLIGASLSKSNLIGAKIQIASLGSADFGSADLWGATLEGANLIDANLKGADQWGEHGSDISHVPPNFIKANLIGVNFSKADLVGANLSYTKIQGGNLIDAKLRRANLKNANLKDAILFSADLEGAEFKDANLSGDLAGARNLKQDQINEALGDLSTKLPEGLTHPEHWKGKPESENP